MTRRLSGQSVRYSRQLNRMHKQADGPDRLTGSRNRQTDCLDATTHGLHSQIDNRDSFMLGNWILFRIDRQTDYLESQVNSIDG